MPDTSPPPKAIDHTAFPELIDTILNYSSRDALLSFRGTSSYYLDKINARLFKHACIVCVDCKELDNASHLLRHTVLLVDVDGEKLPIPHFTVTELEDGETPKAYWRSRKRGMGKDILAKLLQYVEVVDSPMNFPLCTNVDMPNLRVARLYHEDLYQNYTDFHCMTYYRPAVDTVVTWDSHLPLGPPIYNHYPNLALHPVIRCVVINVSIGVTPQQYDAHSGFESSWCRPKVIIIVTLNPASRFHDWLLFATPLIHFLKAACHGRTGNAIQVVGLGEALRQTYSSLVPTIDAKLLSSLSLYDLMKGFHWLGTRLSSPAETHVRSRLEAAFDALERFDVPCIDLDEYKKTLTADEIDTQLVPSRVMDF